VASAIRCEKFFSEEERKNAPIFRMHAVILKIKNNKGVVRNSFTN
jgi:hypothetical protein